MTTIGLVSPTQCATLQGAGVVALERWVDEQRVELARLGRRLEALQARAELAECSVDEATWVPIDETVLGTTFQGADDELAEFFWREVPTVRAVRRPRRRRDAAR